MSQMLTRRTVITVDPLTEHLQNLQPEQVDALEMMQGVYSNQIALSAAVVSLQLHTFNADNDVYELADSVAANTIPRFESVAQQIKEQDL